MRWLVLVILLAGCTDTAPFEPTDAQLKRADEIVDNVVRIIEENHRLKAQIVQLKKQIKKSPRERCMDDFSFKDQSGPLYVCSEANDFVIVPLSGRYLLARGLGCGETFEDSFLLFKDRKDVNNYIDATLCVQKEQK